MKYLIPDAKLGVINDAYRMLETMGQWVDAQVVVNRSYIDDESVKLNFNVKGKRYLLVVSVLDQSCQIWHSHNKFKNLQKIPYKDTEILVGKFLIP